MKANELMVGDYLCVTKDVCIKKGTVVEIRSIDADNNFPEAGLFGCASCRPLDENQFTGGVWLDYLEPIPLTPEILEENGFNHISNSNYDYDYDDGYNWLIRYNAWDKRLKIYRNLDVVYDSGECPYMAVHILQHALRLCGIQKEIMI